MKGGQIDPPLPPGKTAFKKPSLIRVNDKLSIDGFTITGFYELLTVTMSESLVLFHGV